MAVTSSNTVRYSDLIGTMYGSLRSLPQNVGSYSSSVPDYLKYPHTDTQSIPVEGEGYVPKINWENNSYAAVVSESDFQTDFNNFMNQQALELNINKNSVITAPLLIKLLTAMYCWITTRFIRVFHPKYTDSALFFNLTLSPTVSTANMVNLSHLNINSDYQTIITALCNQAKAGCRSLMVTNSYSVTF